MIRTSISLLCALGFAAVSVAQQDPQYTQWFMDPVGFNPGAAGHSELTCISGTYRNQWQDLGADPNTSLLNANTFIDAIKGGVMLSVYNDALGQETNNMLKAGYAFHLPTLSNGATVSAGLAVTMFNKTIGNNWVSIDPWQDDPAIPNQQSSASAYDVDLGIYIRKPGSFYAGVSATHVAQTELGALSIQPKRHLYFMGGYDYAIDSDYLVLRTNVLAKTDLNASIADVNVNVLWNQMAWAGVSWRPGDAVAPVAGFQYKIENKDRTSESTQVFRLGYSYDITTSDLQNYSNGSHEVFISYCFKFLQIPMTQRHSNPRFL